jgi:DNA invertase Pin-like site-specific DNA recombinase
MRLLRNDRGGKQMSKRVIELIRVSTQGQAGSDRAGIPAQKEINRRTAKNFDLKIVETIEIVDVSGALVLASPKMHALLRLIESPEIEGVVTKEFSRLIRPDKFTDLALLETFIDTKTILYLPDGPVDLASNNGRFMGTIQAAFAGLERSVIRDRMRDAKEAMRRAGKHPGGQSSLPFGVGYSERKGWHYTSEAEKVKHAFALLLGGASSYVEIARKLNIPRSSLRYLLENPIYTGLRVYDEQRDPSASGYVAAPDGRQGYRRKIKRDPENVIRVPVLDGIVSQEDFLRAQQLIEIKRQKHWRGRTGVPERYTYHGFLTCGECGERLYTHTSKREFYVCKTRHTRERRKRALLKLEPCTNNHMLRDKLEPKIDAMVGEKLQDSVFLARVLREYNDRLTSPSFVESAEVDRAEVSRKLNDLRDKKDRILDTFFEGMIDRVKRDVALATVEHEMESYNLLLGTPQRPEPRPVPSIDCLLKTIEPFADWEFLSRDDRRALLRQLCPSISVYRYTVKSLTLNIIGPAGQLEDRYTGSHPRMAP